MSRRPEQFDVHRPMYARMLRLKFLTPNGFLCFVFLEGAVALGILLALAELVSWWGVIVLPLTVAIMVKLNDVIAGALTPVPAAAPVGVRPLVEHATVPPPADDATARLPGMISRERGAPIKRPWVERAEAQQQWIRQSATRRYE
ncbi:hypothetical protein Aab01nite_36340 [Paractinoplanes abujensis]|uniref:Uncharacterized protein n=1 Tax=Paractinoplanes abujensis TaxID=882441 RepID=A0A7W7CUM5_9ACTN|nr:hypothetical protein [Actinoplanes abujensis]MBB4694744.1 hypothetical protein [Actinoplanes abujensis]GID20044.1 hypothetical protein Aab01nite_36340 [Actinoplanes abujensis]